MDPSEATRASLLLRIRDAQDHEAWCAFVGIYAPLVYGFARRNGLQDADAADVTQDVLRTVARAVDHFEYDRRRGSFRGWLMSVAHTRLCDFLARHHRQLLGSGDTGILKTLEAQSSRENEEQAWEREYRRCVFDWAAEKIRSEFHDSTWQAFWQTSVEGKDSQQVADSLGLTLGAVYVARSRVLARLKQRVREMEESL